MNRLLLSVLAALGICGATTSHASILFSSIPSLAVTPGLNGICSGCDNGYEVYDTFTLATPSVVTEVDFVISSYGYGGQPITVGIYSLSTGLPDAQIYSNTFSSYTATSTGKQTDVVVVPTDNVSLAAGSYDITFYNATLLNEAAFSTTGGLLYQAGFNFRPGYSLGFDLIGNAIPTPEPASIALLGSTIVGLTVARKRRRDSTKLVAGNPR